MQRFLLHIVMFLVLVPRPAVAQSSRAGRKQAQKVAVDSSELRVFYSFCRAIDTTGHRRYRDCRLLEIGHRCSRDFSLLADRCDSIAFESYRKNPDAGANLFGWMQPDERGFCEDYYMNYPERGASLNSLHIVNTEYRFTEPVPEIEWRLHPTETRTLLGYDCRKATAEFRGRTWTAWFAPDIPVAFGPWKLGGLPGLILSAYDDRGYFTMEVTGTDTSCRPIFIYDDRPADAKVRNVKRMKIVSTTRERVRTLQTLFWKDPVYLNELHGVISAVHDRSGRIVIRKSGEVQLPFIPPLELE